MGLKHDFGVGEFLLDFSFQFAVYAFDQSYEFKLLEFKKIFWQIGQAIIVKGNAAQLLEAVYALQIVCMKRSMASTEAGA
ncbi:hypothetical protein ACO0LC_14410 [Undibacterium sp. JH2W]|uniref:hypothetical protein n=1 Tax=Undibacterium sp. JH2W TaxID=3413037 RepID=UPI003BF2DD68